MKGSGKKIIMLTAYDYPTARLIDETGVEIILIGDSIGNVVLGYDNTIPVTMDDMLHHTKAVVRGTEKALVIVDMPFMSYQLNPENALLNASRFIKEAGAHGVKIEGLMYMDAIKKIIEAGIPVMGHLGFTPQSVNQLGGYRVQGRTPDEAKMLIEGGKALEKAGVFSIVLEMVPSSIAEKITKSVSVPVIGIGAGAACDGQVLVINDILGLSLNGTPKFAKKYADISGEIKRAVSGFIRDVKSGSFPGKEHSF